MQSANAMVWSSLLLEEHDAAGVPKPEIQFGSIQLGFQSLPPAGIAGAPLIGPLYFRRATPPAGPGNEHSCDVPCCSAVEA